MTLYCKTYRGKVLKERNDRRHKEEGGSVAVVGLVQTVMDQH